MTPNAAKNEPASFELEGRRIAVVTCGDLSRSPRSVSHALSLASAGAEVDLVGQLDRVDDETETFLPLAIRDHPRITIHPLRYRELRSRSIVRLAAAAVLRSRALKRELRRLPEVDLVMVQNPPTLPSLPCVRKMCRKRGIPWIIDWHNTSHHVLMQKLGRRTPVVKLLRRIERSNGRRATGHLAVSRGFGEYLADETGGGVLAWAFYDRPLQPSLVGRPSLPRTRKRVVWRSEGRAIAVAPSSWTQDDNFPMLFRALDIYRDRFKRERRLPLLVVLTGRGPEKERYLDRIAEFSSGPVVVEDRWLPYDNYLELLLSADLGISLHDSASGIDLPMKIVDMFSAGVPVLAFDYGPVLTELVDPGGNGRLFQSAEELADLLESLLDHDSRELEALRRGVALEVKEDWSSHWSEVVLPLVLRLLDEPEPQLRLPTEEIHLDELEDDFRDGFEDNSRDDFGENSGDDSRDDFGDSS